VLHPDLGTRGPLSDTSTGEQRERVSIASTSEFARLQALNTDTAKFGFPFLLR
jgi:2-oxo-4-hydroxy-4-carboxy--5-ureidoimidazoline (OHCU) decarboxylase